MKIAFIGLGNMGTGIAQCILKSGHDLIVWNRTATKTGSLVALGALAATTAREAAAAADVVITSLMDDKSVMDVVQDWRRRVGRDAARRDSCLRYNDLAGMRGRTRKSAPPTAVSTFPLRWLDGQMRPRAGGLLRSSADRPTRWKG